MSSPSWTVEDLKALESAIAQGVVRVEYSDKKITYRSLDEMIRIRNRIRKDLGFIDEKPKRFLSSFNKGIDGC